MSSALRFATAAWRAASFASEAFLRSSRFLSFSARIASSAASALFCA